MGKVILTGDRPTGKLHLGHYVGSLKRRVELQNSGEYEKIFIMIADAQALTDNADNPEKIRQNIIEVALDYLSAGLDPEKVTIFIQSQVPELCELAFYYMNLVTVQRLQRNPTVKQEIQLRGFSEGEEDQNKKGTPVGFFTYPISQASDITAFRATTVPVGVDQAPMIEQTREIVHKFNSVYGETLVVPEMVLPENATCYRLPGTDGKAKMSKSLGNCIYLSDTSKEIKKKVNSMFTDPGHVEGNVVFTYLDAFSTDEHFAKYLPEYENLDQMKDHYRRGGLGDGTCKKFLFNIMEEFLQPMRERRKHYEQNIPQVYEILRKGSEAARAEAARTLADVRKAMKIDYFDDADLIAEHTKKYQG